MTEKMRHDFDFKAGHGVREQAVCDLASDAEGPIVLIGASKLDARDQLIENLMDGAAASTLKLTKTLLGGLFDDAGQITE
jgi:hypothetical protein